MLYLGLDVSKHKIDCCLKLNERYLHRVVKNNQEGFKKLSDWLAKYTTEPVTAVCEATGTYSEPVACHLHDNGHIVSVVNPLKIKSYVAERLENVKTDKQDAKHIAQYAHRYQDELTVYTPPTPDERRLKALTRQLDYYTDMLTAQRNRLLVATDETAAQLTQQTIEHIQHQINATQALIDAHIQATECMKEQAALLKTVRGIGNKTIPHLLVMFGEKTFSNARQVTAYLGLNPIIKQSGGKHTRHLAMSKQGDKHIRTSLYMPAVCCFRLPEWKPYINRLKQSGKHNSQIIGAIMRKLAVYCYSVLKQGKPFSHPAVNLPTAA